MYASIIANASFWSQLTEIDREFQQQLIAKGCPLCGGPLHVANHPRKPRGVPLDVGEEWSWRFNTCCGHCRRRCMPPSVRFLGRRVYAGVIVMLASMLAILCEAASKTLARWHAWWTQMLPAMTFWTGLRALFASVIVTSRLPTSLLERYESTSGAQSKQALLKVLRALSPITTGTAARTDIDGRSIGGKLAQKMGFAANPRDLIRRAQAPPK